MITLWSLRFRAADVDKWSARAAKTNKNIIHIGRDDGLEDQTAYRIGRTGGPPPARKDLLPRTACARHMKPQRLARLRLPRRGREPGRGNRFRSDSDRMEPAGHRPWVSAALLR